MSPARRRAVEDRLSKPVPPIEVEASLSGAPDGVLGVSARASSRLDAEIELEILPHDGLALVSGGWKSRGRRPEFRAEVRAADPAPREILVRASLSMAGARCVRVVPLALRGAPAAPAGSLKRNSRGEKIREFGP